MNHLSGAFVPFSSQLREGFNADDIGEHFCAPFCGDFD